MTPHAVSLLVCLSVIISLKVGKLHCNAPIGAVVTYHEHFYEQSFPNPHSHLRTSPLHLQHSPTSSFIKSNLFLFSIALGLCIYCNLSIHTRTHLINFARELCPQTIPRKAPLQSRAERRRSPLCLDRLVHSSHWLDPVTSHYLDRLDHTARQRLVQIACLERLAHPAYSI